MGRLRAKSFHLVQKLLTGTARKRFNRSLQDDLDFWCQRVTGIYRLQASVICTLGHFSRGSLHIFCLLFALNFCQLAVKSNVGLGGASYSRTYHFYGANGNDSTHDDIAAFHDTGGGPRSILVLMNQEGY